MPRLADIATARSGDKGAGANLGVIARSDAAYDWLAANLTAERIASYFARLNPGEVVRYDVPNLRAFNFVLPTVLGEGGSKSLRTDAQGKTLGQVLLLMEADIPAGLIEECAS